MLNNFLNNTLNRCSTSLSEAKIKIKDAAELQLKREIDKKIPSPASFKIQLNNIKTSNQKELLKIERVYNKIIRTFDSIIAQLEQRKANLESIRGKVNSIETSLSIFEGFIDIITPLLNILKGITPVIDGSLAASAGPISNGLSEYRLGKKKEDINEQIKKAQDSLKSFSDPAQFFRSEASKLLPPINKAISTINQLIEYIKSLRAQIVLLYQNFIGSLQLSELDNSGDEGNDVIGNEDLDSYLEDEDDLSTVISDAIGGSDMGSDSDIDVGSDIYNEMNSLVFKKFNPKSPTEESDNSNNITIDSRI